MTTYSPTCIEMGLEVHLRRPYGHTNKFQTIKIGWNLSDTIRERERGQERERQLLKLYEGKNVFKSHSHAYKNNI